MKKMKVLIVDDDHTIRRSLNRLIDKEGYKTIEAENGESALKMFRQHDPAVVFLDLKMPGMDGLAVLKAIKEIDEDVIVFIISAFGTFKDVVQAMKLGAFDYIQKPYQKDEIKICLFKASKALRLEKEVRHLRYKTRQLVDQSRIIVKSSNMRRIINVAKDVAKSIDTPVLIHGETGVGKEIIARVIHDNSPRNKGPFLTLNCGAIPKDLLESELFGYEKGAFTGAGSSKPGLFELAEEGTLLLDEIGELSLEGQVKLLRILENKTFLKIGGTAQKIANARILASTNKDLSKEIDRNNFREDLYYRLNVINIEVPPLRKRREDIIPLTKTFIEECNQRFNKRIKRIAPKAKEFLLSQSWRGNVRELKNLIERVTLLTDSEVLTFDSLAMNDPELYSADSLVIHLTEEGMNLDQINRRLIEKVLQITSGNQVKAAKILDVPRSTLRHKLKKYKIVSTHK